MFVFLIYFIFIIKIHKFIYEFFFLDLSDKKMCDNCIQETQMKRWLDAIVNWNGSYPDPIDNSPCDHCPISK